MHTILSVNQQCTQYTVNYQCTQYTHTHTHTVRTQKTNSVHIGISLSRSGATASYCLAVVHSFVRSDCTLESRYCYYCSFVYALHAALVLGLSYSFVRLFTPLLYWGFCSCCSLPALRSALSILLLIYWRTRRGIIAILPKWLRWMFHLITLLGYWTVTLINYTGLP